jgi:predicted MFS family arabinose efflux permease
MIMPPIAGWLISGYGWAVSYAIIGLVSFILITAGAQFLRRDPGQLGLRPYGYEDKPDKVSLDTSGISLEEALRTRTFWIYAILWACFVFGIQVIMVHIVPHVIDMGISTVVASSIMTLIGVGSVSGRVLMGIVGDKIGYKPALTLCFIGMIAVLLSLMVIKDLWALYIFAIAFGFTYGGHVPQGSPIAADLFGLRAHGAIFGVTAFFGTLGGAIGPIVAGSIYDVTGRYEMAFLASAALVAIGLGLLFWLLRMGRKAES